jgi:flagellar assembly protein FliH
LSSVIKNFDESEQAAAGREFNMAELGEDARRIIATAEETARHILENAEAHADARRKEAYDRGFNEGKAAGETQLESQIAEEIRKSRSREVANLVKTLQNVIAEVNDRRDMLVRDSKEQLVALAVNIARTVVKREVECSSEIAKLNLEEAIRLSARRSNLLVHVSEADMETLGILLGAQPELSQPDSAVELVPSADVPPGGCLVESTAGLVDARIETQLREIEKVLLGEPHGD